MEIMESRYDHLEGALKGLDATQVSLIRLDQYGYGLAGYADDLGIYYFIPKLAHIFGISLDTSINIFLGILLLIPFLISTFFFFSYFTNRVSRFVIICGHFLLTIATLRCSDVYIAPFFAVGSTLPFFFLDKKRSIGLSASWLFKLLFCALVLGYANKIRSHAGTGAILFILLWIFLDSRGSNLEKFWFSIVFLSMCSIPYLHFQYLEKQRDGYLQKLGKKNLTGSIIHPKWHSIYIGLGYLPNSYGIEYSDTIAADKVKSIQPQAFYCSTEYENVLRTECFKLLKSDIGFCVKTFLWKAFAVFKRVLMFMNFGIIFYFYVRPSFRKVIPFVIAILFYSIPGLLVIPINSYLTGLTATLTLCGIYMICLGIEKWANSKPKQLQNLVSG